MSQQVPSDGAAGSHPGTTASASDNGTGRISTTTSSGAAELSSQSVTDLLMEREETKKRVLSALRHFPDFPIPGINFIDILPIFQDHKTFDSLLQVLELQIKKSLGTVPDVIVGLDARGFLFGPSLALRLNCSFVPVRKQGKMPGPCVTASYEKEYGADYFQMQSDGIKPGQTVLVVDDIIATGGSAAAAGSLVNQLGGKLMGYLFMIEIASLNGRKQLGDVPILTLLETE